MDDLTYEQKLRIEALRAASRIVASWTANGDRRWLDILDKIDIEEPVAKDAVLYLADHFYDYLEAGKS